MTHKELGTGATYIAMEEKGQIIFYFPGAFPYLSNVCLMITPHFHDQKETLKINT